MATAIAVSPNVLLCPEVLSDRPSVSPTNVEGARCTPPSGGGGKWLRGGEQPPLPLCIPSPSRVPLPVLGPPIKSDGGAAVARARADREARRRTRAKTAAVKVRKPTVKKPTAKEGELKYPYDRNKAKVPCPWCGCTRSPYWRTIKEFKKLGDRTQYCNPCSGYHRDKGQFSPGRKGLFATGGDRKFHPQEDDQEPCPDQSEEEKNPYPTTLKKYIPVFRARADAVIGRGEEEEESKVLAGSHTPQEDELVVPQHPPSPVAEAVLAAPITTMSAAELKRAGGPAYDWLIAPNIIDGVAADWGLHATFLGTDWDEEEAEVEEPVDGWFVEQAQALRRQRSS